MKYKLKLILLISVVLLAPFDALALMKSANYIIYETVMQSFDGPTISNVSCAAGTEKITVTWDTDVIADGFVVYDTNNGFTASKEQGSSAKSSASHSVVATGLTAGTYYYKVKSTRVNGGVTTDSTIRTCAPAAAAACPTCPAAVGGGLLIIDKTDKAAPLVANIQITNIKSDSAAISWTTDEDATSFVEYGKDTGYGKTFGEWTSVKSHSVVLNNLISETEYHFRALSSDGWGNLGKSEDNIFKTISLTEEIEMGEEPAEEEDKRPREDILAEASRRAIEIMNKLSSQVSLNILESTLSSQYDAIEKLANLIPPPILSGEPKVELEADGAVISWLSDKEASSLVAIAPEKDYKAGRAEPYSQVTGDSENLTTEHRVRIFGLEPNTLYHYQLRSKAAVGPMARSRDFTFRTSIETLQITNYYTQIINDTSAAFKWVTNFEADSAVKITPYRGNVLAVEESKTFKDNTNSVIHEISIKEFEPGVVYEVELSSRDARGNIAAQLIPQFSTAKDDLPPEISYIKVDSTVFLDKEGKIQTIISWLTSEPATSRAHWQEGVHGGDAELTEKTGLNTSYAKEHIMVFTKFKPGTVYSFRVESVDSGGNASLSKVHTFMTPKKKESIFQMILRILEQTFGWVKKIL
ncbi:MAG: fibronectin type III domain-containing protein [bacterium]|nr:fibronectin type III domain-containing protein [bacterium]